MSDDFDKLRPPGDEDDSGWVASRISTGCREKVQRDTDPAPRLAANSAREVVARKDARQIDIGVRLHPACDRKGLAEHFRGFEAGDGFGLLTRRSRRQ